MVDVARKRATYAEYVATELGDAAEAVEWAARNAIDDNRYLKLRRIALENLARIL
ncbi:MAG TPA: hypothetical protein VF403_22435 [Kofleriaceae bacterium]